MFSRRGSYEEREREREREYIDIMCFVTSQTVFHTGPSEPYTLLYEREREREREREIEREREREREDGG